MRRFREKIRQVLGNKLFWFLAGLMMFIGIFILFKSGTYAFYRYLNGPLLLWLVLLFVFVMHMTGIWKDFISGFRLVFSKGKNITRMDLQKAAKAMESARKLVVLESVIAVTLYMVDLLYKMTAPLALLGPLAALILLSIAYSSLFSMVAIPMRVRLENMAISFMEETGEAQENDGVQDEQTVYFQLRAMGLTDREAEVARLVCCGLANKEIGQMLYISDTTVKKHMTHILEKTNCDSREALSEMVKNNRVGGRI